MPFAHMRDRPVLPNELARQRIDLLLALGGDRGEVGAITRKECASLWRLAAPVGIPARLQVRDHRRHPADNLPIDQIELMLRLPARLLHPPKKRATVGC
ncbi:MAG: hypothetical protein BGO05_24645 [Rhizobiales bacterium 63-7]|nr:MAG: hypothetical protein BGO05_24645 [Rhizobiales bacterium 63-7]